MGDTDQTDREMVERLSSPGINAEANGLLKFLRHRARPRSILTGQRAKWDAFMLHCDRVIDLRGRTWGLVGEAFNDYTVAVSPGIVQHNLDTNGPIEGFRVFHDVVLEIGAELVGIIAGKTRHRGELVIVDAQHRNNPWAQFAGVQEWRAQAVDELPESDGGCEPRESFARVPLELDGFGWSGADPDAVTINVFDGPRFRSVRIPHHEVERLAKFLLRVPEMRARLDKHLEARAASGRNDAPSVTEITAHDPSLGQWLAENNGQLRSLAVDRLDSVSPKGRKGARRG